MMTPMSKDTHNGTTPSEATRTRHPKWTRQETIILMQGKKAAERGDKGNDTGISWSDQIEPKWEFISTFCKRYGADRTSQQCQKRWSALAGDYKRIKTWELHSEEKNKVGESYWMITRELRQEMKLPASFEKEFYDIMDGKLVAAEAVPLSNLMSTGKNITEKKKNNGDSTKVVLEKVKDVNVNDNAIILHGYSTKVVKLEPDLDIQIARQKKIVLEKRAMEERIAVDNNNNRGKTVTTSLLDSGMMKTHQGSGRLIQEEMKRSRVSVDEDEDLNPASKLVKVLKSNSNMLKVQLDAYNVNLQADRAQRKEETTILVAAAGKLSEALLRIAEKL